MKEEKIWSTKSWREIIQPTKTTIEELARKLRPIFGEKIDKLWQAYIIEDIEGKKEIETIIQLLYTKTLNQQINDDKILLEPPPKEKARGEYPIGHVVYNDQKLYPFAVKETEMIQHVAIFGKSGAGKTVTATLLIAALLRKSKPFMVLDWKRNYRDLLPLTSKEILVFTVGRKTSPFTFNPLIPPPGTPPRIWLKKLIEVIAHSYFVGEGVMYLLQNALDSAYKQFNVYSYKEEKIYPTFHDVFKIARSTPQRGRASLWLSSTLRTLGAICFGEMGEIMENPEQTKIEELLKKNVVLELDALTDSDKTFLIESLLLWIHHYRMAEGKREEFKHAIIIEEAHHILLRKKQELQGGEAITDVILREIRELGEGIILIDQHPSLISIPALGNTFTTIVMNLKHRSDVNMAADCILLEDKEYIGWLQVGDAIVRGRWHHPFLVKIANLAIQKGVVTDQLVKEKMKGYFETNFTNSDKYQTPKTEKRSLYPPNQKERVREPQKTGITCETSLSEEDKNLLKDIIQHPLAGVVERYKRLNWSRRKGNIHKDSVIQKGLAIPVSVSTKGGRVVLLKPTYKAIAFLREQGIKTETDQRKGGIIHEFWKNKIAQYYRNKGFEVDIEKPIGEGKSIDIVITKENFVTAVEIETGKSYPIWNIEKDKKAGYQNIISIAVDEETETKIKKQLREKGLDLDENIKIVSTKAFNI